MNKNYNESYSFIFENLSGVFNNHIRLSNKYNKEYK